MPTVTVIIPVYKVERYLDACVESVVRQSYADLEILLVDDGSPDRCPALCDAWAEKDPRIKVIHRENGGLSAARNAGLAAADSEYLVFLDADDALRPGALQAVLDAQNTAPQSFVLWHYTTDEQDAAAVLPPARRICWRGFGLTVCWPCRGISSTAPRRHSSWHLTDSIL